MASEEMISAISALHQAAGHEKKGHKSSALSIELIRTRENELNLQFSDDYVYFLENTNDIFYGSKEICIIHADQSVRGELSSVTHHSRKIGLPFNWIPICEDNGDYYFLLPNGQVRFWSHEGESDEAWPSLASWIKNAWL
jgi:hypothetical protein